MKAMNKNAQTSAEQEKHAPSEERESLWRLTFGPAAWAAHFVLSYVTAAVWCAKVAGRAGPLGSARLLIGLYTLVTLLFIGYTAWRGWRYAQFGNAKTPHDDDTAADRHRFLGFATVLLCGLSAVATLYVALGAVLIRSCL